MNKGKLTLREVGARSIDVAFSHDDEWVKAALVKAAPHEELIGMDAEKWAQSSRITGSLTAERLDPEYSVFGTFESRVPLLCPRCGEEGTVARSNEFRLFLKPVGPRETFEESDDPDYIFLETPYIDLTAILSEQIVAAESVVERPDLDPTGGPHQCSKDASASEDSFLNKAPSIKPSSGQTSEKGRNSPFAVLGKLKNVQTKDVKKTLKDEG